MSDNDTWKDIALSLAGDMHVDLTALDAHVKGLRGPDATFTPEDLADWIGAHGDRPRWHEFTRVLHGIEDNPEDAAPVDAFIAQVGPRHPLSLRLLQAQRWRRQAAILRARIAGGK